MDEDTAIQEFCSVTGANAQVAREFLAMHNGNMEEAADTYLASIDKDDDGQADDFDDDAGIEEDAPIPGLSRGVTSVPQSSTASSSFRKPIKHQPKKKFATLGDMKDSSSQASGHDDDDDNKDQEYFAGGDKSGLAVQEPGSNPRDHIQRLLDTARRAGPPPPREEPERASFFTGAGQTLGADDVPSQRIEDPTGQRSRPLPMVERVLHLWSDGFSVDDGDLYRYDDPANRHTLEMINRGSAPLEIMNVEHGQAVDVKLEAHRGEAYVQPAKKFKPFGSSGHRLGSPTPGEPSISAAPSASSTITSSMPSSSVPSSGPPTMELNDSQPIVTLQIRLADGTRLPSRFNTSHTIGDVYDFVNRASPASVSRTYSLATTFPTKELTDKSQVIGEMAEFKRGGVIVQKWA